MAKRKHSADWMLARVREYLSGKGSYRQIARANGLSVQSLRDWVKKYEEQGEASFIERAGKDLPQEPVRNFLRYKRECFFLSRTQYHLALLCGMTSASQG